MLPTHVLNLIREYSKPLTRVNWRDGVPHALLFKQSPVMKYIIRQIQKEIQYIKIKNSYALLFNYGETIFNPKEIRRCEKEIKDIYLNRMECINFYICAKRFLKNIYTLHFESYTVNGKKYYQYIFIKK
jgi:hypothetical protein